MDSLWPPIEQGYWDAEGFIELDVYNAAAELWKKSAKKVARAMFNDEAIGHHLMLKAAAIVTRVRSERENHIRHLPHYLFTTFKHLLCEESGKQKNALALAPDCEKWGDILLFFTKGSAAEDVERMILVDELVERMDAWTREVFELLVLGHDFGEIAEMLGEGAVVRNKFYRGLKRLARNVRLPRPPRSADLPPPET